MTRLIDEDKAIEATWEQPTYTDPLNVLAEVRDRIRELPTVEAVPVRRGRWEFIGGYGYQYRCSECINCVEQKTKFCPHCGARMDKGKEE